MKKKIKILKKLLITTLLTLGVGAFILCSYSTANASTRIKDIVQFEGVRDNLLVGYGLVVGLNGTGDTLNKSPFTKQSMIGMLERLGVNIRNEKMKTDNIAAVTITATLPPFINQGSRIDVSVQTLGDASSLQGGTLLVTPLLGADGKVYSVAQGPVAVAGFTASGDAASITQNIPTTGSITSGAIVEREITFDLADMKTNRLALRNPDLTTSRRIAAVINKHFKESVAIAQNPASVKIKMPSNYKSDMVSLLTDIEQLTITPDQVAKVIINQHSGVIVMGSNVRISTIAIAQGNLTIKINETPQVSQPKALSQQGSTTVVPRSDIQVNQDSEKRIAIVPEGVSLQELVSSLNALGVGPRDIITILQSIRASGALQAKVEVI